MKLWVDDVRLAPPDYIQITSVNTAIRCIQHCLEKGTVIEVLDLDHDAGDYAGDGGDYIRILDWMEEQGISVPVRLHTQNPVGRANMEAIIRKNGWKEIY